MIADPKRKPHQDNDDSDKRRRQEEALNEALKNTFFWLADVPIFTSDHERRMYSWIAALIHHAA